MPAQTSRPASPFLSAPSYESSPPDPAAEALADVLALEMTSPFLTVYQSETGDPIDPEAEEMVELLSELYNEEFEEDLARVVFEMRGRQGELFQGEAFSAEAQARFLDEELEPLIREAEGLAESLATAFESSNPATVTDAEIERLLDAYTPQVPLAPSFEQLFGGLKKKFKKLAKKAKRLAKRGLKKLGSLALGPLFKKLRRLIRPLLKKVLRRAIDRLPKKYRPIAHKLAKRLGFLKEIEGEAEGAVPDLAVAQLELDAGLAELLVDGEASPADYADDETDGGEPVEIARERFVDEILELDEGADPTVPVEGYVTAILTALRLGIKVVGRKRVVKVLSRGMAKLIRPFVGRKMARPLSRALVDSGLRLVNLEATGEDERRAAGDVVAATVEETVRRVADLPASVLDDPELLEASVVEAFERSATRNLPAVLSAEAYRERPDLKEAAEAGGAWVPQPRRGPKLYKKYSRVWKRRLSPQALAAIRSWNGRSVAGLLKEHMALEAGEGVEARIHLYEALPGTQVPEIQRLEGAVPGMAPSTCGQCSTLHPLTRSAAAVLTGEPGLARRLPRRYRMSPRMTRPGQRFFFLEIEGAAGAPPGADQRCSLLSVRLDLPRSRAGLSLYLGEARAQEIAGLLRSGRPAAAVAALTRVFRPSLRTVLAGDAYGRVRIVSGAVSPRLAPGPLLRRLPESQRATLEARLLDHLTSGLASYFKARSGEFLDAADSERSGVTLTLSVPDPALLVPLRATLEPGSPGVDPGSASDDLNGSTAVRAVAGYRRD